MVQIKRQIVPMSVSNQRTYGISNPINYITIHQTGNTNRGANAQAHANIQTDLNPRQASWQYSVDDEQVIQSFEDKAQCYHAGDGRGPGNLQSIGIELCINSDGDYKKTLENGAELVKFLMDKYDLSIDRIKQHYDWSGKNCPAQIRANKDGINWTDFKNMVAGKKVSAPKHQVKSSTVTKSKWTKVTGDWTGQTLANGEYGEPVEQLQTKLANNNPPFYPNKGAKNNGIDSYYGDDTEDAVRRFQSYYGLDVDGLAGKQVYNKLKPVTKPVSNSVKLPNTVYRATRPFPNGTGVRAVQEALASVHYYPDKNAKNYGIDGYYGTKTADAVRRFQSTHGLVADGIYGSATRKALEQAMK